MLMKRSKTGRVRVVRRVSIVAAIVVALCSVTVATAYADDPPPRELVGPSTERWAQPDGVQPGLVDWSREIGYCIVGDPDSSCGITQTTSVRYSISGEFGLSTEYISASLGIEQSEEVAVGINCRVERSTAGTRYVAYPTFTRHYFYVMEESGRSVQFRRPSGLLAPPAPGFGETVRYPRTFVDVPDGGVACKVRPLR